MIIFCNIYKAVSLRIDCFFHTQKGVIDLCVRFGTKDTVSEPATSTLFITIVETLAILARKKFVKSYAYVDISHPLDERVAALSYL